jgi:membrane fusion protein (multidrug efflux system)
VRAPIDGVVGKVTLQPGDFLATGQAAMPLVATRTLWVDANFKETDLTHVGVGQPATVEVDTYPGKKWNAHVASISPASGSEFSLLPAQNATGNWVKIVQRIPVRAITIRSRPDAARRHEAGWKLIPANRTRCSAAAGREEPAPQARVAASSNQVKVN